MFGSDGRSLWRVRGFFQSLEVLNEEDILCNFFCAEADGGLELELETSNLEGRSRGRRPYKSAQHRKPWLSPVLEAWQNSYDCARIVVNL
jgi:hypothetical protein